MEFYIVINQMKQIVQKCVLSCHDNLYKVSLSDVLDNNEDDSSLVLSTNCAIERRFGLMKSKEFVKFNMSEHSFSALNCMKLNNVLVKLNSEADWETLFKDATAMTQENLEFIKAEENARHEVFSDNLQIEENFRNEKKTRTRDRS
jgi:hypothetical protein